mgnify:CR=1 FL=1
MIEKPIFIIGCNRSGTTLLFRNLSEHPDLWSLYVESQVVFHSQFPVDPLDGERVSGPVEPSAQSAIRKGLYQQAHNKEAFQDRPILGQVPPRFVQRPLNRLYKPPVIRLVEKTPANSLRIPLLVETFPDAHFIYVVRRGEAVVSSLMEGWKLWNRSPAGEPFSFRKWHYLTPPGWQEYTEEPLESICAFQWIESNRFAHQDLEALASSRYLLVRHEDLVEDPASEYGRIMRFCGLRESGYFDRVIARANARAYTTGGSAPRRDKWKQIHGAEIESIRDRLAPVNQLFYGGD